jgi:hypothetical protein
MRIGDAKKYCMFIQYYSHQVLARFIFWNLSVEDEESHHWVNRTVATKALLALMQLCFYTVFRAASVIGQGLRNNVGIIAEGTGHTWRAFTAGVYPFLLNALPQPSDNP